jgi:chitinase
MISVFGATEFPTTLGINPIDCASKLATYVKGNNLDGVDIDWEDNHAMEAGSGEEWLVSFTIKLRELLPSHIITHAPQAPYFSSSHYKNGGYLAVHHRAGHLIDFYNIQFYNQGNTTYYTYQRLFIESGGYFPGTSVKEIAEKGVPLNKIIVGKPVNPTDATNTGWMDHSVLAQAVKRASE